MVSMASYLRLAVLTILLKISVAKLPLQDVTATVNQLFTYTLSPEDFPDHKIQITETGKDVLPAWLTFDNKNNELVGVPTAKDKGSYILSVGKAVDKEMFAVTVTEPTKSQVAQLTNSDEHTICKPRDSITVVYIKLNTDTDSLLSLERSKLIRTISSHLSLKPDHISVSSKPKDLLDTSSALVFGTGDAPPSEDSLSALTWIVGCGAVKSQHMDVLEKIEGSAKDGSMGKALWKSVSGWQVQSNQPKILSKRRLKRKVFVTATPVPAETTTESPATTTEQKVRPTATTTAMPSTTMPELTIPLVPQNKAPVANRNLLPSELLSASGGQVFRWSLPDGLFTDPEGLALRYSIKSRSGQRRWIVTSKLNRGWEVIGLAAKTLEHGNEELTLIATDQSGEKANVTLSLRRGEYGKKHLTEIYKLKVKANQVLSQPTGAVYLALTLQRVANFEKILIDAVENDYERGFILVTLGDNRGKQTACPRDTNTETLLELRKLVHKAIPIDGINAKFELASIDMVTQVLPCQDTKPVVNAEKMKQYNPLTVKLGELYESVLPIDLFTDHEDADLTKMRLKLLVDGKAESDGWVSVDSKTRKLQAFTWDNPNSQSQFALVAMDSAGNDAEAPMEVRVVPGTEVETNQFTLKIEAHFSKFANSHSKQLDLYKRINSAFKDSVVKIISVKEGSIVVKFSVRQKAVSSTRADRCPEAVKSFKEAVFDGNGVRKSFNKRFGSYKLQKVSFTPSGPCVGDIDPQTVEISKTEVFVEKPENESSLTIIIVAIVISVVVLIIIIVIIVCIRRRKAANTKPGRKASGDVEKRVPVRMDEEMKSLNNQTSENAPLMTPAEVSYKPTPPAYPGEERADDYEPDTPPVSEPDDERRFIDKSP